MRGTRKPPWRFQYKESKREKFQSDNANGDACGSCFCRPPWREASTSFRLFETNNKSPHGNRLSKTNQYLLKRNRLSNKTHNIPLIPHEQDSSVSPTFLTAQLSFGWLSPTIIYLMIMPSIRDLMQNYTFFEYGKCFSQNH